MKYDKIAQGVTYIGVDDLDIDFFEGQYEVPLGVSYNSYLIDDEKVAIMDTVDARKTDEWLENLDKALAGKTPSYLIVQHLEPDHAGSVMAVLGKYPDMKVICSRKAEPMFERFFDVQLGERLQTVQEGETLSLGEHTLQFFMAPMVHWPDNMVTYSAYDKILYSNDAFGQHMTTTKRFDYEVDLSETLEEAKAYYANICWPYSAEVATTVKAVKGLDIDLIMPAHGIIWKDHIQTIIDCYDKWDSGTDDGSAIVVYNSMYQTTYTMALAVVEAFAQSGIETRLFDLANTHYSRVTPALLEAKYLAVGTSTHYRNMLPEVAEFLTFMKSLVPPKPNKFAFAFGSYGWSGEATKEVNDVLKAANFDILMDPISHNWTLDLDSMGEICDQVKAAIANQAKSAS